MGGGDVGVGRHVLRQREVKDKRGREGGREKESGGGREAT